APAQALDVEAAHAERIAVDHHVGRHVLRDVALEAAHAVRAHLDELVQPALRADDRPVVEHDVAGEPGVAGDDRVAADDAVVRDVHAVHDPVVVADGRPAGVLDGAGRDRAELADGVAVADDERGLLAGVLLVLRRAADRVELPDAVAAADRRPALDHAVRADDAAGADRDAAADDAVGTDLDVVGELGAGLDDRRRVDLRHSRP